MVDKKEVVDLVLKSQFIGAGESIDVVIAKGIAPYHGKDTQFECLLENVTDRRPSERIEGSLDYYDLGEIPSIEAGVKLMKLIAHVPSINGRSVTGQILNAVGGKKLTFNKCKGAQASSADPELLVSTIKGQPVVTDRGVSVENVYTVKNVDIHTGHIKFDGSLGACPRIETVARETHFESVFSII